MLIDFRRLPRGLILKLTLPLVFLVILLSWLSSEVLRGLIDQVHQRSVERRSLTMARTIEDALERSGPSHHALVGTLLQLLEKAGHKAASVTGPSGKVAFASQPQTRGTTLAVFEASGVRQARDGTQWYRWSRPIVAGPTCAGCHPSGRVIGHVVSQLSLSPLDTESREMQRLNFLAGLLLATTLAVLLALVQYAFIYRPVKRLTAAIERVRGGDLSARIERPGNDELGDLAHSFNDMAASLDCARSELDRTHHRELAQSEKLAGLGQLFTSVAHELKNQLAGVTSAIKVLEGEMGAGDPNKPVMGKVLSQMEKMSRTAVTALDFARPLKPAVTAVDLADLVDRTLFFVERQAASQGVQLRKRYAPDLPPARVDEELMKQVILNLLLNGMQSMPSGGALEVQLRAAGPNAVELAVSDQGVGIPTDQLERIFSPFFSTKRTGTGLGLYIARQIVETQQGALRVTSTIGRGSCFTVTLPAWRPEEEPEVHDSAH